jgi:nitrate/TMAO reductase-like tetraheme cytochrome c subunit
MINTLKNTNILGIAFLIVLTSGFLRAGQLDLPEPEALQETYLKGSREEKSWQCRNEVASSLGQECSFCHNDDVTEFTEKGNRAIKDMKVAIALGVKCDYCHTGKKQFTKKFKMAEKMFKLSEMMDVECNFCHTGKDILTHRGRTAKTAMLLQKWTKKGNKSCLKCHVEKKQFELNSDGKELLKDLMHEGEETN